MARLIRRALSAAPVALLLSALAAAGPIIWGNSSGGAAAQCFVWLEVFNVDPAIGIPNRVQAINQDRL